MAGCRVVSTSKQEPVRLSSRLIRLTERLLPLLVLVELLFLVFLNNLSPLLRMPDMGWHLAQARWMYENGQILTQNWFNYPLWGQPLVNEYAFYHLLLWPLWCLGPYPTSLFFAFMAASLIGLLFLFAKRNSFSWTGFAIATLLAIPLLLYRLSARPEIIGYLCTILFAFWLFHLRGKTWPLWKAALPLVLLQVCWVNSHSSFILGPVLVTLFGLELIGREMWQTRRLPWALIFRWAILSFAVGLACLVSPQPLQRILLPFFHQGSKPILVYVSEMHGLQPDLSHPYVFLMLALGVSLILGWWAYRNISFSLLALTSLFAFQTFENQRHITLFAFLALLTLASCSAWKQRSTSSTKVEPSRVPRLVLLFLLLVLFPLPFTLIQPRLDATNSASYLARWQALERDQSLEPQAAIDWLKSHQVDDRLLHRTEIGGRLQYEGLSAQCFADTGFGKYTEDFINRICLLCERPGLLPAASKSEKSSVALVSNLGYDWPLQLSAMGWRCVFTSANGAIWMAPDYRPDLPAIAPGEVEKNYLADIQRYGPATRQSIRLRQMLLLANQGAEALALEELLAYAKDNSESGLFWQTANRLAFPSTTPQRNAATIQALEKLAQEINPDGMGASSGFQAQALAWQKQWPLLIERYGDMPRESTHDELFSALGQAYLETGQPQTAIEILGNDRLFGRRNGARNQLLGRAWAKVGDPAPAALAYAEALYFHPDDERLQNEVEAFLLLHPTPFLRESLNNARHVF